MGQLVIDRRTFLKAAGLTAVGVAAPRPTLGGVRHASRSGAAPSQASGDPLADQAEALAYDRDAIFRFVADEIQYEPYPGVLRGPRATLAGRAGNAADKALLLAALLEASFVPTRFVVGTLDDAAAASLAGTAVDLDAARTRAVAAAKNGTSAERSGEHPPPEVQAIIDRLPEIDASVTEWASGTIDASVRTITDALAGAGIVLPTEPSALPGPERTSHVWLQVQFGTAWLDLDPTLRGSEPGRTIAAATAEPVTALPDALRHRVDITIVAEHISGTSLEQEVIVEHSLFADELTDVPIVLVHAKPEGLEALGGSISQILTGGVRYQAILQVGRTAIMGVTGLVLSGGGGPLEAGESVNHDGQATGEWLEVSVTSPDGRVATSRRTLFDRIGEAARLEGMIDPAGIPPVDLVDLGQAGADEFLPLRAVHFLSVATGATRRPLLRDSDTYDERALAALGMPAPMYHVARDTTNVALALERGVAVHLDGPNIAMHSYVPAMADAAVEVRASLDLLHRSFAVRPVAGIDPRVPPGVLAGVTSHVAERLRMGEGLPVDLTFGPPGVSAGVIVERASAEGTGLRVLQGLMPADTGHPPEVVARLEEALSDGWVAIVPERPVAIDGEARLGWWLVDPATGATVDMLDDGRGVTLVEWAVVFEVVTIAAVVAYVCISRAMQAAAFHAEWEALRRDAAQLGVDVADLPARKGVCS